MINKYSLLAFLLIGIFLFSCEKQEDETENRDKIVGQWDVVENEVEVIPASVELREINKAYIVNVTRSDIFADEVYIYNFFNIGASFNLPAYVEGNRVTIPEITLEDQTIHGEGSISGDNRTIEWSYWVEDPYGDEKEYRATYTFRE